MTVESESVPKERNKELLVSVIIPVYQVSDYVERCLLSVMKQTCQNIECIIVDDATPDDSIAKCERLIDGYNGPIKFKILHHDRNRGLSAARNTGTNAATGDYLYYLDSDDEISLDCIEKLMSFVFEGSNLEMVQGNYLTLNGYNEEIGQSDNIRIQSNDEARYQFLVRRNINYTAWNKLLKRSFIIDNKLYYKEGIIYEDLLWTSYLIKYLNRAQLCTDITYYYFIRPNSISFCNSSRNEGLNYCEIFEEILHNLTPSKEKGELNGYKYTFCVALAKYLKIVPELKTTFRLYQRKAKQFGCWNVYLLISFIAVVSRFCNLLGVMKKLYVLRRNVISQFHPKTLIDMNKKIVSRLQEFIENEARSCSMDNGCITPEYVYRMWGGKVAFEEIVLAFEALKEGK